MINSFLGSGNSTDPKLIFLAFDPTGDWLWDYIAKMNEDDRIIQEMFTPLINFSISLRSNQFLPRKIECLELDHWKVHLTVRVELEIKIIQTFSGRWEELTFDPYYVQEYRNHELSMSFFPIAPGWKKPFSIFMKKLFSITQNQFDYYDEAYPFRANLISQYLAKVFKNPDKPIIFLLLPSDERKCQYMLRWMLEIGIINILPNLTELIIPNENGTIWIIPNADSLDIDFELMRDSIIQFLSSRNPSLLIQLSDFYKNKVAEMIVME